MIVRLSSCISSHRTRRSPRISHEMEFCAGTAQRAARDRDETMLEPDFDPIPTAVQIGRCSYLVPCRAPRCTVRGATIVSYSNKLLPFVANTTAFEHRVDGRLAVGTSVRRRASTRTLLFSSPADREQSRVVDGVDRPIAPDHRGGVRFANSGSE